LFSSRSIPIEAELDAPPLSNILACHVKSCNANNFPLLLSNVEIEIREAEYNEDFLKGFWPKIEWSALVDTAKTVSRRACPPFLPSPPSLPSVSLSNPGSLFLLPDSQQLGDTSLPESAPDPSVSPPEAVLKALHHVLMEVSFASNFPSPSPPSLLPELTLLLF